MAGGVACLLLAGSAAAGLITAWPGDGAGTPHGHPGAAAARGPGFTMPPVRVAWVDDSGQLHIGDLATGTQRVMATVDASPADPMIVAGGRLFWAGINENAEPVREYDIGTGKIRYLPRGNSVFTSADGRHLYIVQTGTRLIELPADGTGAPRQLALPAGWHMSACSATGRRRAASWSTPAMPIRPAPRHPGRLEPGDRDGEDHRPGP